MTATHVKLILLFYQLRTIKPRKLVRDVIISQYQIKLSDWLKPNLYGATKKTECFYFTEILQYPHSVEEMSISKCRKIRKENRSSDLVPGGKMT